MLSTGDRHFMHTGRSGTGCPVRLSESRGLSLPTLMPGRVPGVDAGGLALGKRYLRIELMPIGEATGLTLMDVGIQLRASLRKLDRSTSAVLVEWKYH